jgi:hypothetical protein
MKSVFATMLAVMISLSLFAQNQTEKQKPTEEEKQERKEEARERIKAARAAYLTQRLDLTTAEAEKFWPVYREYSEKREAVVAKFRDQSKDEKDGKVTMQAYHKGRQELLDLEKSYSDRFLQVLPAQKVIKLSEAEKDFNHLVRRNVKKGAPGGMKQGAKTGVRRGGGRR